ncbi:MAG: hypothetical protein F6K19_46415 [Cyanothece sp. SIO1E1]|nr:hypothetical protein [Cyanothece sp. SIO1E1]
MAMLPLIPPLIMQRLGSSIVLKGLLVPSTHHPAAEDEITIKRSTIQRLMQGSDRQLALIHSLLEAHTTELQGIALHCEPIQLKPVVDSVLIDLNHSYNPKTN